MKAVSEQRQFGGRGALSGKSRANRGRDWRATPSHRVASLAVTMALAGSACGGHPGGGPVGGHAGTTTPSRAWLQASDCSAANGYSFDERDPWVPYDHESLRGVPGETRLPADAAPIVVAALGEDVVVLEGAEGSQLRARRVDAQGATAWVTPLGILSTTGYQSAATSARSSGGFASDFPKPVIVVRNERIMVLWARQDGRESSPVSFVHTTLSSDGTVGSTSVIKASIPIQRGPDYEFWDVAMDGLGEVTMVRYKGWDSDSPLVVEHFATSGVLRWSETVQGRVHSSVSLAAVGESVFALLGGRFLRWDAAGTGVWDRQAPEGWSSLTTVEDIPVASGGSRTAPALVVELSFSYPSSRASYRCIVDEQGQPLAVTAEDNLWSPQRAWSTPSGLLVFGEEGALLHGESGEHLLAFDQVGDLIKEVTIGAAGGRELHQEVTVEDVTVTSDGAIVVVGSRTDLVAGVSEERGQQLRPEQLELSRFVVRLAPPAGLGDLDNVPPPK